MVRRRAQGQAASAETYIAQVDASCMVDIRQAQEQRKAKVDLHGMANLKNEANPMGGVNWLLI